MDDMVRPSGSGLRFDEPENQETTWQFGRDEPPSYDDVINENRDNAVEPPAWIPPQNVYIDGILIFPSIPSANALYQLSRDLVAGTRITIGRIDYDIHVSSQGISSSRVRDRSLYTFSHQLFDDSVIEVTGKRREVVPFLLMVKSKSVKGHVWTVHQSTASSLTRGPVIFVCKPVKKFLSTSSTIYEWQDSIGQVIAVEERPGDAETHAPLRFMVPLDQKMYDLLVTVWCARIWNHNLKASGQIRTISQGKNAMGFKE